MDLEVAFIYLFIYFFYGHTCGIRKVPGAKDWILATTPSHAGSFNHCTRLGIEPASLQWPEQLRSDSFFFFLLFKAAPEAYGSSQAGGPIGATAVGLCHSHSTIRSEPCLQPTQQLMAMPGWIPLSKARDWTCVLWWVGTHQIRFHCAMTGTPAVRYLTHCATAGTPRWLSNFAFTKSIQCFLIYISFHTCVSISV